MPNNLIHSNNLIPIFFFLIFASACSTNPSKPGQTEQTQNKTTENTAGQPEILDIKTILINGKLGFESTPAELKKHLGKADSTLKETVECGGYFYNWEVTLDYYGSSCFVSSDDTTVVNNINFKEGRFEVKTDAITLNKNTSLEAVKKVFPVAAGKSFLRKDQKDKKEYTVINLQPGLNLDDTWILRFYKGKLFDMQYFIPC